MRDKINTEEHSEVGETVQWQSSIFRGLAAEKGGLLQLLKEK